MACWSRRGAAPVRYRRFDRALDRLPTHTHYVHPVLEAIIIISYPAGGCSAARQRRRARISHAASPCCCCSRLLSCVLARWRQCPGSVELRRAGERHGVRLRAVGRATRLVTTNDRRPTTYLAVQTYPILSPAASVPVDPRLPACLLACLSVSCQLTANETAGAPTSLPFHSSTIPSPPLSRPSSPHHHHLPPLLFDRHTHSLTPLSACLLTD